jgi:hypothetical protein
MKNNTPTIDHTLNIIYNMQADIVIGKNLLVHLSDIHKSLLNLLIEVKASRINNEDTTSREALMTEILKMGNEILVQLKNPE